MREFSAKRETEGKRERERKTPDAAQRRVASRRVIAPVPSLSLSASSINIRASTSTSRLGNALRGEREIEGAEAYLYPYRRFLRISRSVLISRSTIGAVEGSSRPGHPQVLTMVFPGRYRSLPRWTWRMIELVEMTREISLEGRIFLSRDKCICKYIL